MPSTSRRRAALVGALTVPCVVAAGALTTAPAGAHGGARGQVVHTSAALTDLQLTTENPTDGAWATFLAVGHRDRTHAVLVLKGVDRAVAGQTYGVHVHVGPCVAGDGAAAGPHYNHDTANGVEPPEVSPRTEVWLDFTASRGGYGFSATTVPFRIAPGAAQSVVVHELPTDPSGAAGGRFACLPVRF